MPPKKSKAEVKKKEQKVVDRTFGLKNKNKSKKVQQYVQNVQKAATMAGKSRKELQQAEMNKKAKEDARTAAEKAAEEMKSLFQTVVTKSTIVPAGADPKSVVCAHFKAGSCNRGNKCKYSHDVAVERKVAKINLYADPREEEKKSDTMDQWDQNKLEQVVNDRDEKEQRKPNETQIVCKYFLDAIEKGLYGWFWTCPNGNAACKYKHRLPPGFVFTPKKRPEDRMEDEEDEKLTLMEQIEEERRKLDLQKCTPVTLELFLKWKADKEKKREAEVEKKRKDAAKKGGRGLGVLSGRDLFKFDPSLFEDDEDAVDADAYEERSQEEEGKEAGNEAGDGDEGVDTATQAINEDLFLDDAELPDDEDDEDA